MPPLIGLILNPRAGRSSAVARSEAAEVEKLAIGNGVRVAKPATLEELERVCRDFRERGIGRVAVLGGDGTISLVMTALVRVFGQEGLPSLAVLGGGTMNVLAGNLGPTSSPRKTLAALIRDASMTDVSLRPLVVNERFGFVFANGAAVRFLERFYGLGPSPTKALTMFASLAAGGLLRGYRHPLFGEIFSAEEMTVEASRQGRRVASSNGGHATILAATVPWLPGRVPAFRGLSLGDEMARMIVAERGSRAFELILAGARLLSPLARMRRGLNEFAFDDATITTAGPTRFTLDGEIVDAPEGRIRLRLGAPFSFVRPGRPSLTDFSTTR